ncbi:antitoxin family protein [Thermodesulfovibrio sp. 3907-1M]|uniref:Antitoxin family protein n=1 Tax=Thermodesulfovibrio autotrophicus TaxID=3118333 RepID=A0AAU8GXT4_9BACT
MKILKVVYENGVLKPLSEFSIKEKKHFKIIISDEDELSIADLFSGIIKGLNNEVIEKIALDPEFEIE